MNYKIFSIYDEKAKAFGVPFFKQHRGQAVRDVQDVANNRESILSRHPSDFSLYMLGNFDDDQGKMEALLVPELIIRVSDLQKEIAQ